MATTKNSTTIVVKSFEAKYYDRARQIFREGMVGLVPHGTRSIAYVLGVPFLTICITIFGVVYVSADSLQTLFYTVFFMAALGFLLVVFIYVDLLKQMRSYVEDSLSSDLLDIEKHYMKKTNTHFFVALRDNRVVGCVAIDESNRSPENEVNRNAKKSFHDAHKRAPGVWGELRRMSVCRKQRKMGIAKRLHAELVAFARKKKMTGIFLSTSSMQGPAINLYKSLGYQLVYEAPIPVPLVGRAVSILHFELTLSTTSAPHSSAHSESKGTVLFKKTLLPRCH